MRTTATKEDQLAFQKDVDSVNEFIGSIGMQLNAGKSHLLNISFGARPHRIQQVSIGGVALGEVEDMRFCDT